MQQLDDAVIGQDSALGRAAKRSIDLLVSIPLLALLLPVVLMGAIGSAVTFRAWPFFTQLRVGRDGQPFTVLKIRTLPTSTPRYCAKHDLEHRRVPRFGCWLRRLHLDELPQLLMVIAGKMSLVGPRPEMRVLHAAMDPVLAFERTRVRPGCTGLWQISTASAGLIHEAPEYDRLYVCRRSLRLDLWVLVKTVGVMVLGRPKIDLEALPPWIQAPGGVGRRAERVGLTAVVD